MSQKLNKTLVLMDVEFDGPYAGDYSMVSFGAVVLDEALDRQFEAKLAPISDNFIQENLRKCNTTRRQHESYPAAGPVMVDFTKWLAANCAGEPVFVSDNVASDWQFMNYYLWKFAGHNPFGHTGRRIGDFCAGLERNLFLTSHWKKQRGHDLPHDPLQDAILNAKAFMATLRHHGISL